MTVQTYLYGGNQYGQYLYGGYNFVPLASSITINFLVNANVVIKTNKTNFDAHITLAFTVEAVIYRSGKQQFGANILFAMGMKPLDGYYGPPWAVEECDSTGSWQEVECGNG